MPILGPDGRPITAAAPPTRAMMTKELGAGGVSVIAGVLNDDEHVRALQGLDGVRVFDKMRRIDGEVAAVLASLQLPILAADISPGEGLRLASTGRAGPDAPGRRGRP